MNTKGCKAKGRGFQNKIRNMYRAVGAKWGLEDGDIEGRQMGGIGVDIVFSPAAQGIFDHEVECKKHRRVAVSRLFEEHLEKYESTKSLKLLFHENDRSNTLVTMKAADFISLVDQLHDLKYKLARVNGEFL